VSDRRKLDHEWRWPSSNGGAGYRHVVDRFLASIALVLLSPIILAGAIAIKLDSSGPVLYRQRRFGQDRAIFIIYKFRTMRVMEEGQSIRQATAHDPRITAVGRILRRTGIDEIPQLFNVIRGEMSLVGPRPHALVHDLEFARTIEHYWLRTCVRPGITGWAQIHGHHGEIRSHEDVEVRLAHDLYYIANRSFLLDLKILVRTIPIMIFGLANRCRQEQKKAPENDDRSRARIGVSGS
jgi:putative colanic acid biosynthesis UDP-glucose lipid carrier transferase